MTAFIDVANFVRDEIHESTQIIKNDIREIKEIVVKFKNELDRLKEIELDSKGGTYRKISSDTRFLTRTMQLKDAEIQVDVKIPYSVPLDPETEGYLIQGEGIFKKWRLWLIEEDFDRYFEKL